MEQSISVKTVLNRKINIFEIPRFASIKEKNVAKYDDITSFTVSIISNVRNHL